MKKALKSAKLSSGHSSGNSGRKGPALRAAKEYGFIKGSYIKSWEYLKKSRNFIFIIVGIFFAFALAGFFIPAPQAVSDYLLKFIKELVGETSGLPATGLIWFIFFNNIKTSFFGMALGVFFGIFSVFISLFNGYILGFVAAMSVKQDGVLILWRLFPHGIFELPAVWISLGLGLKLGGSSLSKEKGRFRKDLLDSLRVFAFIVIPLLIIAAIIEGSLISILG